jgi:hypothetical protein
MTETPQPTEKQRGPRKSVKILFLVIAVAIAGAIVMRQKYLPVPKGGWIDNDLEEAFNIAQRENRDLLILFVNNPPSQRDRDLRNTTLSKIKNIEAIAEHQLVPVMVRLTPSRRQTLMNDYALTTLPTMLVLNPQGDELARAEGHVGEVAFAESFLGEAYLPAPPGNWIDNNPEMAFQRAQEENRNILALFVSAPPTASDHELCQDLLSEAACVEAIGSSGLIPLIIRVSEEQQRDIALDYSVRIFPTMLIMDPDGESIDRASRLIDQTRFINVFLTGHAPTIEPSDP